jgi:transposase
VQAQRFLPVGLTAPPSEVPATAPLVNNHAAGDTIEIVLPDGSRVRVGSGVNLSALAPCHDSAARMIALPSNVRVWLACGHTYLRCGFDGLASQAQQQLRHDPFGGQFFVFRGERGDLIKVLCWDGQEPCLFAKRPEKGRFVWPQAKEGAVSLTPARLSMLLEGIDWRMKARTWRPELAKEPMRWRWRPGAGSGSVWSHTTREQKMGIESRP